MKTYRIPCSWEMYGYAEVHATSLKEAIDQAENHLPLPNGNYVNDSFSADREVLEEEYPEESSE